MDEPAFDPPPLPPSELTFPSPGSEPALDVTVLPPPPLRPAWGLWLAFLGLGTIFAALYMLRGEFRMAAGAGLDLLPFLLLAVMAYTGVRYTAMRAFTVLYVFLLVCAAGFVAVGAGIKYQPGGDNRLVISLPGLFIALVLCGLCYTPEVRRLVARWVPLDPTSFVHATALAVTVGLTAAAVVSLLALETPPLYLAPEGTTDREIEPGAGLRLLVYRLAWLVPVAFLAVGYPLTRNFRQARERLGLLWPTWRQVAVALAVAVILVPAIAGLNMGLRVLWQRLGWPTTNAEEFAKTLKFAISPLGAVVIGVTAGLGEELGVRGVLQPRLGILLSNLLFTAAHALQYEFEALISVFCLGLVFGLLRRRTNTTTSAIAHGTYDAILILLVSLAPYFEQHL
jgi:membrane protease YdiL (CAAX protease family)